MGKIGKFALEINKQSFVIKKIVILQTDINHF